MELKTELCKLLNIEYPIIQGGMAWVSTGELAAAVSNGGGLGIIGTGNSPVDVVKKNIDTARNLTTKPFGVNVMLKSPSADDILELLISERVAVVTTGAGNPGKYIERLKGAGIRVIPVISSVALARRMEGLGVDAVVAEGCESGGHIGELTTMALVPQVVDAVGIPVIAAGGIGDGRGLAAALSLGSAGVQVGTRFICSLECTVHNNYKMAIINARDRDAVSTGQSTGHPVRCLKNKLTREYKKLELNGANNDDIVNLGLGKLKAAVVDGDVEYGSVMAGQISGMIKDIKPCSDIIKDMVSEAENVIKNTSKLFRS